MNPHQLAKTWLHNCLVLDTETTGMDPHDEIVEICILNHLGEILLNSLVRPTLSIPSYATDIHGITNAMVATAPRWSDLYQQIADILDGQCVVVFNAEFDQRLMRQTAGKHGLTVPEAPMHCAMMAYARYYGDWNERTQSYVWQSLETAADQQGVNIEGQFHRALTDCQTTLAVLQAMAEHPECIEIFPDEFEDLAMKHDGVSFGEFVNAYIDYARFSGWNTSRSVAISKVEAWVCKSIGSAGMAFEWKQTGIDGLATWKAEQTQLHTRISNMTPEDLVQAVRSGEDVNGQNQMGETPLIRALRRWLDTQLVSRLIELGADIHKADISGATPLHCAARFSLDCTKLLLAAGARMDAVNNSNQTPICNAGNELIFNELVNAGANLKGAPGSAQPIHCAARYAPSFIARLISAGADVNGLDDKKRTPMHWALFANDDNRTLLSLTQLVGSGGNLELKDSRGGTVLLAAIEASKSSQVIDQILSLGADFTIANRNGITPLHVAAKEAMPNVIATLLKHGADPTLKDKKGMTPINYAIARNMAWPA